MELLVITANSEMSKTGFLNNTNLFSDQGFRLSIVNSFESLRISITETNPKIVILDSNNDLAENSRFCREIRNLTDALILVVSGQNSPKHESSLLDSGADDLVTKPVVESVLFAHLKALARRCATVSGNRNDNTNGIVSNNGLRVNNIKRTVTINDVDIKFTPVEFDLFLYLADRANNVVSRDELYHSLMNIDYNGIDRRIDIQISRLRKKLDISGVNANLIKTIRNEGYLFVNGSEK